MEFRIQSDTVGIDWNDVANILQKAGMAYRSGEIHQRAFEKSQAVIFVFDNESLIAFGRMLSDGEYQSAIYDVAVLPEYQGQGIGKLIVDHLVQTTPGCNIILYAAPGKELFYEKIGFRRMKTGMALFAAADIMREKGFTE